MTRRTPMLFRAPGPKGPQPPNVSDGGNFVRVDP